MPQPQPSSAAQFTASRNHEIPAVEPLTGGVSSIPIPMPIPSLRYVLVYALDCGSGLVLIDAGWGDELGWTAFTRGLASAGYDVTDVRAILVTHGHRDHYGLADRIRDASGAWVGMHERDAKTVDPDPLAPTDERFSPQWLLDGGVPADQTKDMVGLPYRMQPRSMAAAPDRLLDDGERIAIGERTLTAIWTPGHSPGHLCFLDRDDRRLYSGDHILPRISPHVGATSEDEDPLSAFLDSQAKLRDLPVDEVMPAHEYRIRGLSDRIAELVAHHEVRLGEVAEALRVEPGLTAWEVAARLHWSRTWDAMAALDRRSALGETLAHLSLLRRRGYVTSGGREPTRWTLTRAVPSVLTEYRQPDSQE